VEINFVRRVTEDGDFPAVIVGRPAKGQRVYYELQPLIEQFGKELALERLVPIHVQLNGWVEVCVILPVWRAPYQGPQFAPSRDPERVEAIIVNVFAAGRDPEGYTATVQRPTKGPPRLGRWVCEGTPTGRGIAATSAARRGQLRLDETA
jgi:hypothetical protein